jgi:hypothetical protein
MSCILVRYKVKAARVAENEALVRAVFAQLDERRPEGLHYASFKAEDGLSFVHVASIEGDDNPLQALPAFKAFVEAIRERCDEPPVATPLTEIGRYRFF